MLSCMIAFRDKDEGSGRKREILAHRHMSEGNKVELPPIRGGGLI